jgi:hypothetical protein
MIRSGLRKDERGGAKRPAIYCRSNPASSRAHVTILPDASPLWGRGSVDDNNPAIGLGAANLTSTTGGSGAPTLRMEAICKAQ